MTVLVTGGSGSGKSAYAEDLAVLLSKKQNLYYLAAMQITGEESRRKAERHRRLRSGKGFVTIEQPVCVHKALEKMQAENRTVLLECVTNLTANEMFSGGAGISGARAAEKIIRDIRMLNEETANLVIVSGNVFEDGIVYEEPVMEYIRALGKINQQLAAMAEQVVEVTAGIPVMAAVNNNKR